MDLPLNKLFALLSLLLTSGYIKSTFPVVSVTKVKSKTQGLRPRTQKKIRDQGQGQPYREQTLSRPRAGMLESKAKDQGHKHKCSPKKRSSEKFFRQSPEKTVFSINFSGAPQTFNNSKHSAVLKPRTGQFSRTWGFEAKDLIFEAKDFKMWLRDVLENSTSAHLIIDWNQ